MKSTFLLLMFLAGAALGALPKAVIFDIDDTLVNTDGRTLKVLHDVGAALSIAPLRQLRPEQVHYYCSVTCRNAGLSEASQIERVCGDARKGTLATSEWGRRFFSDGTYLAYDGAIGGAAAFVRRIASDVGARVVYLTGRNARALGAATREQLARHGFPPGELIAKGDNDPADDVAYKRAVLAGLKKSFTVVAAFDDSAGNANLFAEELPATVPVVRPTRDTHQRQGVSPRVVQIGDYLVDRWKDETTGEPRETDNRAVLEAIVRQAAGVVR